MIIVVMGPTGVGKTDLSLRLAEKYNCEIVNADSMQVYKGLDIATAKIKKEEQGNIVHHLFDICDVDQNYTVYDYQRDARKMIEKITKRGKNVLMVGGTGLYIKAALFHYEFSQEPIKKDYTSYTTEELLAHIKRYPVEKLPHPNNRKRLERLLTKLENHESFSSLGNQPYYQKMIFLYLTAPRDVLYPKLRDRIDKMFEEGLLEEVKKYKDVLSKYKSLQTGIGYKEFIPYFKGEKSLLEVKEEILKRTKKYAKRQDTFFRNQFDASLIEVDFSNKENTFNAAVEVIESQKEK